MPSFREILSAHTSVLLIDAASTRVQAGWFVVGETPRWQTADADAGIGLFSCIETLNVDVNQAQAFVFCEGPGSILGIRTTAVALRTWCALAPRPVFAYGSLELVAHTSRERGEFTVIADARRETWHAFKRGEKLQRVATSDLSGDLITPEGFRHWSSPPPSVRTTPYLLAELLPRAEEADIFRETREPDAFLHEEPSYAGWTPRIHRAPVKP
jgi:tRNA threonylcarbamoyladenosine biosynthesis protein TsaB